MARMTLGQALDKARELEASVRRLEVLYHAELTGLGVPVATNGWKQQRAGRKHELEVLAAATADLVAGLAGIGPARNGQLGGQRQGGMATAATAADLVAPRADTQRARLLDRFSMAGVDGWTDVQLATLTGLPANSVRPRRVELVDAGWLEAKGKRQHNGRDHTVWTLTEAARERLQTGDTGT